MTAFCEARVTGGFDAADAARPYAWWYAFIAPAGGAVIRD